MAKQRRTCPEHKTGLRLENYVLTKGRKILYANPKKKWILMHNIDLLEKWSLQIQKEY